MEFLHSEGQRERPVDLIVSTCDWDALQERLSGMRVAFDAKAAEAAHILNQNYDFHLLLNDYEQNSSQLLLDYLNLQRSHGALLARSGLSEPDWVTYMSDESDRMLRLKDEVLVQHVSCIANMQRDLQRVYGQFCAQVYGEEAERHRLATETAALRMVCSQHVRKIEELENSNTQLVLRMNEQTLASKAAEERAREAEQGRAIKDLEVQAYQQRVLSLELELHQQKDESQHQSQLLAAMDRENQDLRLQAEWLESKIADMESYDAVPQVLAHVAHPPDGSVASLPRTPPAIHSQHSRLALLDASEQGDNAGKSVQTVDLALEASSSSFWSQGVSTSPIEGERVPPPSQRSMDEQLVHTPFASSMPSDLARSCITQTEAAQPGQCLPCLLPADLGATWHFHSGATQGAAASCDTLPSSQPIVSTKSTQPNLWADILGLNDLEPSNGTSCSSRLGHNVTGQATSEGSERIAVVAVQGLAMAQQYATLTAQNTLPAQCSPLHTEEQVLHSGQAALLTEHAATLMGRGALLTAAYEEITRLQHLNDQLLDRLRTGPSIEAEGTVTTTTATTTTWLPAAQHVAAAAAGVVAEAAAQAQWCERVAALEHQLAVARCALDTSQQQQAALLQHLAAAEASSVADMQDALTLRLELQRSKRRALAPPRTVDSQVQVHLLCLDGLVTHGSASPKSCNVEEGQLQHSEAQPDLTAAMQQQCTETTVAQDSLGPDFAAAKPAVAQQSPLSKTAGTREMAAQQDPSVNAAGTTAMAAQQEIELSFAGVVASIPAATPTDIASMKLENVTPGAVTDVNVADAAVRAYEGAGVVAGNVAVATEGSALFDGQLGTVAPATLRNVHTDNIGAVESGDPLGASSEYALAEFASASLERSSSKKTANDSNQQRNEKNPSKGGWSSAAGSLTSTPGNMNHKSVLAQEVLSAKHVDPSSVRVGYASEGPQGKKCGISSRRDHPSTVASSVLSARAGEHLPASAKEKTPARTGDDQTASIRDQAKTSDWDQAPTNIRHHAVWDQASAGTRAQAYASTGDQAFASTMQQALASTRNVYQEHVSPKDQTPASTRDHSFASIRDQASGSTTDQTSASTRDRSPASTRDQILASSRDQVLASTRNQSPASARTHALSSTRDQSLASAMNQTSATERDHAHASTRDKAFISTRDQAFASTGGQAPASTPDEAPNDAWGYPSTTSIEHQSPVIVETCSYGAFAEETMIGSMQELMSHGPLEKLAGQSADVPGTLAGHPLTTPNEMLGKTVVTPDSFSRHRSAGANHSQYASAPLQALSIGVGEANSPLGQQSVEAFAQVSRKGLTASSARGCVPCSSRAQQAAERPTSTSGHNAGGAGDLQFVEAFEASGSRGCKAGSSGGEPTSTSSYGQGYIDAGYVGQGEQRSAMQGSEEQHGAAGGVSTSHCHSPQEGVSDTVSPGCKAGYDAAGTWSPRGQKLYGHVTARGPRVQAVHHTFVSRSCDGTKETDSEDSGGDRSESSGGVGNDTTGGGASGYVDRLGALPRVNRPYVFSKGGKGAGAAGRSGDLAPGTGGWVGSGDGYMENNGGGGQRVGTNFMSPRVHARNGNSITDREADSGSIGSGQSNAIRGISAVCGHSHGDGEVYEACGGVPNGQGGHMLEANCSGGGDGDSGCSSRGSGNGTKGGVTDDQAHAHPIWMGGGEIRISRSMRRGYQTVGGDSRAAGGTSDSGNYGCHVEGPPFDDPLWDVSRRRKPSHQGGLKTSRTHLQPLDAPVACHRNSFKHEEPENFGGPSGSGAMCKCCAGPACQYGGALQSYSSSLTCTDAHAPDAWQKGDGHLPRTYPKEWERQLLPLWQSADTLMASRNRPHQGGRGLPLAQHLRWSADSSATAHALLEEEGGLALPCALSRVGGLARVLGDGGPVAQPLQRSAEHTSVQQLRAAAAPLALSRGLHTQSHGSKMSPAQPMQGFEDHFMTAAALEDDKGAPAPHSIFKGVGLAKHEGERVVLLAEGGTLLMPHCQHQTALAPPHQQELGQGHEARGEGPFQKEAGLPPLLHSFAGESRGADTTGREVGKEPPVQLPPPRPSKLATRNAVLGQGMGLSCKREGELIASGPLGGERALASVSWSPDRAGVSAAACLCLGKEGVSLNASHFSSTDGVWLPAPHSCGMHARWQGPNGGPHEGKKGTRGHKLEEGMANEALEPDIGILLQQPSHRSAVGNSNRSSLQEGVNSSKGFSTRCQSADMNSCQGGIMRWENSREQRGPPHEHGQAVDVGAARQQRKDTSRGGQRKPISSVDMHASGGEGNIGEQFWRGAQAVQTAGLGIDVEHRSISTALEKLDGVDELCGNVDYNLVDAGGDAIVSGRVAVTRTHATNGCTNSLHSLLDLPWPLSAPSKGHPGAKLEPALPKGSSTPCSPGSARLAWQGSGVPTVSGRQPALPSAIGMCGSKAAILTAGAGRGKSAVRGSVWPGLGVEHVADTWDITRCAVTSSGADERSPPVVLQCGLVDKALDVGAPWTMSSHARSYTLKVGDDTESRDAHRAVGMLITMTNSQDAALGCGVASELVTSAELYSKLFQQAMDSLSSSTQDKQRSLQQVATAQQYAAAANNAQQSLM